MSLFNRRKQRLCPILRSLSIRVRDIDPCTEKEREETFFHLEVTGRQMTGPCREHVCLIFHPSSSSCFVRRNSWRWDRYKRVCRFYANQTISTDRCFGVPDITAWRYYFWRTHRDQSMIRSIVGIFSDRRSSLWHFNTPSDKNIPRLVRDERLVGS